ncbi:hypothetical protein ACIOFV_07710 [Streptomyces mirabilis]|uniref:hypothetical protein n=1 Tax=Streptomyces mirabilis TaxID=68239 RepID=UPI0037F51CE3
MIRIAKPRCGVRGAEREIMGEWISAFGFVLLDWVHPVLVAGEMIRWIRGWKMFFRPEGQLSPVVSRVEANEPIPDEQPAEVDEGVPVPNVVLPQPVPLGDAKPKRLTVYVYEF